MNLDSLIQLPTKSFDALSLTYYPKKFVYIRAYVELSVISAIVDDELCNQVEDPTIMGGGLAVGMEL
jgi:hypothetical protein